MPLIEIKYFESEFTDDERRGIIRTVTDAMVSFTGEEIRPYTWVVLEEVRSGSWGIGGSALGLPAVRALQGADAGAGATTTADRSPGTQSQGGARTR
jgi:4-oxalocrotonate tautomerase